MNKSGSSNCSSLKRDRKIDIHEDENIDDRLKECARTQRRSGSSNWIIWIRIDVNNKFYIIMDARNIKT